MNAETQLRIEQLNARYAQCLDDRDIDNWPAFFARQCLYKIYPRENAEAGLAGAILFFDSHEMLRDRVLCVRDVNMFAPHTARHILSRSLVSPNESGGYQVRTNFIVAHSDVEGRSEVFAVGEYQDKIIEEDGVLRFREKVVLLDTFTVPSHLAEPL
jgi:anthranilate 1,2-dioxygenase small subunit